MNYNSDLLKIISNYVGRLWSLFSVFIFIPFYIEILGIESYAIIGFYSVILGIINFADAGISSSITREFSSKDSDNSKFSIFKILEKYFLIVCLSILVLLVLFSSFISKNWLNSDTVSQLDLSYYIKLIGLGTALQLFSAIYYGALFGLNLQIKVNSIQFVWNIFRSGVVVLVLMYKPTLEVYFIWQIVCNIIYVIILRKSILNNININENYETEKYHKLPDAIVKYILGMIVISIISSINIQADKIITSKMFSLKVFGEYNLVSLLSQIPLIMATPFALTLFPIFSKSILASCEQSTVNKIFIKSNFLINTLIFICSITMLINTKFLIVLWTKGILKNNLDLLVTVVRILTLGTMFLSLQLMFYYLLLAYGKTKYNVYQGLFQLILGLPLFYFCVEKYGLIGVTIPWLLINLISYVYLSKIVFTKYIKISFFYYFFRVILLPFFVALITICFFHYVFILLKFNMLVSMFLSGVIALVVSLMCYNVFNNFKVFSFKQFLNFEN